MSPGKDRIEDYDYDLPGELIAQEPPAERGTSRLLVLHRSDASREHRQFTEITELLRAGDLLVLNETRVFPARVRIVRSGGGSGELLLLERVESSNHWYAIGKPGRALQPGRTLNVDGDPATVHVVARRAELVELEFRAGDRPLDESEVLAMCERVGEVPLPPYIKRELGGAAEDRERYQTVYARQTGSAAAPTAGMHFSESILARLRERGVEVATVCLHVGLGTFQPLTPEKLERAELHEELSHIHI